jgi:hypothetical protein
MHLTELNVAVTKYPRDDLRIANFMAAQRPSRAEEN